MTSVIKQIIKSSWLQSSNGKYLGNSCLIGVVSDKDGYVQAEEVTNC